MGKSQKKKAMRRHNPVRVPDSHLPKGLNAASESSSKSGEILPIVQKMESADSADRKWACVAVSNLIQNDPSTRRLLQGKNIVGCLITRLTDNEEEVIVEAAGALRNLCIDGGYDICAEMYNKNILTPLKTFIPKISSTLTQFLGAPASASESVRKSVYELAENVITILWCLSETSNKALNAINEIHLVPFLMSFLSSRDQLPLGPVTAAAQCLYVLTDDNWPAISEVKTDATYISCLLSIVQTTSTEECMPRKEGDITTLKVLVAGTLRNISPIKPPSVASLIDIDKEVVLPLLQPVISSISLIDITNQVQDLVIRESLEPQIEKLSLKGTPKSDHKTSIEHELERLETQLRTIQLSLEILTGVCATLPDPEPDMPRDAIIDTDEENEIEDGRLDEDTPDIDMALDDTLPTPDEASALPSTISPTSLVPALLALIQPTSLSFPPLAAPSPHPPTTSALSALHISAFECLNNIFLSLAVSGSALAEDASGGKGVWDAVWAALGAIGTQTGLGQERRQEAWDAGMGVLWGVGRVWKGIIIPESEQVSLLAQLCDATTDMRLRVKCIGTLECLAQNPGSVEANKVISNYLLSILPNGSTPSPAGTEPMIQAASALIDIYSDETMPYDINFRQGNYLERLVASVDGVRAAVKAIDRRKDGGKDLWRRGGEVRDNLIEFVKYRRDLKF